MVGAGTAAEACRVTARIGGAIGSSATRSRSVRDWIIIRHIVTSYDTGRLSATSLVYGN